MLLAKANPVGQDLLDRIGLEPMEAALLADFDDEQPAFLVALD